MSTSKISFEGGGGVKAAGAYGFQPDHLHVPTTVLKADSLLNLLEPSGTIQVCHGITALSVPVRSSAVFLYCHRTHRTSGEQPGFDRSNVSPIRTIISVRLCHSAYLQSGYCHSAHLHAGYCHSAHLQFGYCHSAHLQSGNCHSEHLQSG